MRRRCGAVAPAADDEHDLAGAARRHNLLAESTMNEIGKPSSGSALRPLWIALGILCALVLADIAAQAVELAIHLVTGRDPEVSIINRSRTSQVTLRIGERPGFYRKGIEPVRWIVRIHFQAPLSWPPSGELVPDIQMEAPGHRVRAVIHLAIAPDGQPDRDHDAEPDRPGAIPLAERTLRGGRACHREGRTPLRKLSR
jgi:hypothetical protein